ncbi:MAG: hypothetical protein HUJ69_09440 [Lachnospiraceae bacterium]|nr:hypothetical protein [Lachnospiraceae bacterium]
MNYKEKALYVINHDSARQIILENQLHPKKRRNECITFDEINDYSPPKELHGGVRFNYTLNELKAIARVLGVSNSEEKIRHFLFQAMLYCGVKIGDEEALKYVKRISGFPDGFRYYRIAGLVDTNRFTVRVVPDTWQGKAETRFTLRGSQLWIDDFCIGEITAVFTASSLYNLAYVTENQNNEIILSLNPHQICTQNCKFCFKGSRAMLPEFSKTLINLSASEMIRFLEVEYADLDYEKLTEVVILTARFGNTSNVLSFLRDIYNGLKRVSGGKFDPSINPWQRLKISTHLITTQEAMEAAYSHGVRRFVFPIEVFSNIRREQIMSSGYYSVSNNKGEMKTEEVLSCLKLAGEVFGLENIEPVVILGLDSFEETIEGLELLKKLGITMLTHNIFRVYDSDQIELYQMSLEEVIRVQIYAGELFGTTFKQIITDTLPKYHDKYKDLR